VANQFGSTLGKYLDQVVACFHAGTANVGRLRQIDRGDVADPLALSGLTVFSPPSR
jgi:hypothetical protein